MNNPLCQCGKDAKHLDGNGLDICPDCMIGLLNETIIKLTEERFLLAKLAKGNSFFNPVSVAKAMRIRDRVLKFQESEDNQ